MRLISSLGKLCLSLCALSVAAFAADRRTDTNRLRLMSYNAEFLWDGVAPEEGTAAFPWKNSPSEAGRHMAAIAARIIAEDPDVLVLVEVENIAALTRLNTEYLAGRGYLPYLINGTDSSTGQDVGLLTRIDPEGNKLARDEYKGKSGRVLKSVSKHFIARFDVSGLKFGIVGIHLLAQPNNEERAPEREAQADAVRKFTADLRVAGYPPIVMGDFNDYDGAADARDHIDSLPITSVLQIIRQGDPSTPADDLFNATSRLPQGRRFTAWWDQNDNGRVEAPRELTSIDHVLISNSIAGKVAQVRIPNDYDTRKISDHYPVVVDFQLAPPAPPAAFVAGRIFISGVLANPAGTDLDNEAVEITNGGATAQSLAGWALKDPSGQAWTLTAAEATLQPGQALKVVRKRRAMSLNNTGDTVNLVSNTGALVDSITYGPADEGEWSQFGPN